MEQSANEECGICLDALTNPVALPGRHMFCSECLNGWRSKYGTHSENDEMDRKCPLCRERIPPSKEMMTQLKYWRNRTSKYEAKGEVSSGQYMRTKTKVQELERAIGDGTGTIDQSTDDEFLALPTDIVEALAENDIQKVLDWLGPRPIDRRRLNAKNPKMMDFTLMHCAVNCTNSDWLSILLQLGADVDPVAATGGTPLGMCLMDSYTQARLSVRVIDYYAQARVLLEWGAEILNCALYASKDDFIKRTIECGNIKLAEVMNSEFGGRRCEIVNLPKRPDLVGKTCVVEKYLPNKGKYKVVFEASNEAGLVGPQNFKRCDRTPPSDNSYCYIAHENGRSTLHSFDSVEERQAFVASLAEEDETGDADAEARAEHAAAEARAEEAAASLLADLDINTSADSDRKRKKGKKKGKKMGRK